MPAGTAAAAAAAAAVPVSPMTRSLPAAAAAADTARSTPGGVSTGAGSYPLTCRPGGRQVGSVPAARLAEAENRDVHPNP